MNARSEAVARSEAYYDSGEADSFYQTFWGGEDIHIGLYRNRDEPIADASRRTVAAMADRIAGGLGRDARVLDLGAGYGGAARYLAERFGCRVTCLNISETQNDLNRRMTEDAGLSDRVEVVHGDFEHIPGPDAAYDAVWSQDAILHSGDRGRVLDEIRRVLKPGGDLIFTDPMQADDCPAGVLQPVLDRIHLSSLSSFAYYRAELSRRGLEEMSVEPLTNQLRTHYWRLGRELDDRRDEAVAGSGEAYVEAMLRGLHHWVDAADSGYLAWGILHFRRGRD